MRSHVNELAASYDAVHGQFTASKYFPLLRRGGRLCIFVREPTDRTISSYRDALSPTARYRDDVGSTVRSRYAKYTAKLLTLSQYASLPKQFRIYELYTSGLPIQQFAFVGITEEYEASLTLFKAIFGIDLPKYRANVNEEVPDDFSVREREAVRTAQRANYVVMTKPGEDSTPCIPGMFGEGTNRHVAVAAPLFTPAGQEKCTGGLFGDEKWFLAVNAGRPVTDSEMTGRAPAAPQLKVRHAPLGRFWADPFPSLLTARFGGFFEDYSFASKKAAIGVRSDVRRRATWAKSPPRWNVPTISPTRLFLSIKAGFI